MRQTIVSVALGAAMVGTLAMAPATAGAQAQQQQQYQQQQQPPGAQQLSDQDLRAYAAASVEVQEIGSEYQPRIEQAPTPEVAEELRVEAQDEMIEAVQAQGLTVEQYNEIYAIAQANPEVRTAVEQHMMEMQ